MARQSATDLTVQRSGYRKTERVGCLSDTQMKKKKIGQEKNLVLLDRLTQKEQSIISGGAKRISGEITGTIRVYF